MKAIFKIFRIIVLFSIFASIAFYAKTQKLKSRSWSEPLQVVIYPMNGDGSAIVEQYINQLDISAFKEIDQFFQDEAEHYSLSIQNPTLTSLGSIIQTLPPIAPTPDSSFSKIAWWSIKLRYWAYKTTPDNESNLHRIRVFVYYHQAEDNKQLQHSLGLDKGLLVIAHTFASRQLEQQNNIVIAHEILHTVGASDKYDADSQPTFPDGYAEPNNTPLYPQSLAEIMAAKVPLSITHSEMAENLDLCVIGKKTASEINWDHNTPND
ncbi:MAG: hypothetical protein KAH20_03015 [Methylococcales bacterium]|nr:hypothetical protein [Methylococcales bacterium]